MRSEELLQSLKERLLKVFPRLETIAVSDISDVADDRGGDQLRRDFGGVPWWEISEEVLIKNVSALSLFSPEGFSYYYPAYLDCALRNFAYENVVLEFCVYALSVRSAYDESWYKKHFKYFSVEQIDFLKDFSRCVIADDSLDLVEEAKNGLLWLNKL